MSRSLAIALALTIAACGNPAADDATTTSSQTDSTIPVTTEQVTTTTTRQPPKPVDGEVGSIPDWFQNEDAAPVELIEVITVDLDADYLGSMQIDWNNSGLGCTDGVTLTVITPGYVIFFEDADGLIRVHAGENGRWLVCDLARPLEGIPVVTS